MARNLVLVGPMGAGKSTIGRQLALKLKYDFLDTDHIIEERTGADIPWIFDVEGEQGFRQRESQVLSEIIEYDDSVIATGGGIVLATQNRKILQTCKLVVYLTASVEQLIRRTYKDKRRPLLQVADPKKKIRELFEYRDPIYREVADQVIVTDGHSTKHIVQHIADLYSE